MTPAKRDTSTLGTLGTSHFRHFFYLYGLSGLEIVSEYIAADEVKHIAKEMFAEASGSHAWDHTLRVCGLCEHIGRVEKVDMDVLLVGAYLHDIGRCYQDAANGAICHARKGAAMARSIVAQLPLSDLQKDNIIHCIRSHRFRGNHIPKSAEAKVLFDADKLDAIGAVGVARAFLFAGEVGARLHNPDVDVADTKPYTQDDTGFREYQLKLKKIKDRIMTAEGRRLASMRHTFMVRFFQRFLEEYDGMR